MSETNKQLLTKKGLMEINSYFSSTHTKGFSAEITQISGILQ